MDPRRALALLDMLPRSSAWWRLEAEILSALPHPASAPPPEPESTPDTTTPSEDEAGPSSRIRATLPP